MGKAHREREQAKRRNREELLANMKMQDLVVLSPAERASIIYGLIQSVNPEITNWDLLCFCIEYLGSQVPVFPWLNTSGECTKLAQLLYTAHYLNKETFVPTGVKVDERIISTSDENVRGGTQAENEGSAKLHAAVRESNEGQHTDDSNTSGGSIKGIEQNIREESSNNESTSRQRVNTEQERTVTAGSLFTSTSRLFNK